MLRIKGNPQKKPAQNVTFESPSSLKQNGVDMLIALNMTPGTVLTGPEVGLDAMVLVTKETPHFFYNPAVVLDETNLHQSGDYSIISISYTNYQGEDRQVTLGDEDGAIRQAIDHLHNGIERANKKKV